MKKALVLLLAALMMVTMVVGCSAKAPEDALAKIKKAGKLVVGTSPDFAPSEFVDSSKSGQEQYVGYEMEVARYIAKELGVELEIQAMEFKTVQASVSQGQIDLGIAGFAVTEDRKLVMDFTDSIRQKNPDNKGHCIVVRKDDVAKYSTFESFAGKKVGAQLGSLQEKLLKEQSPTAKVEPISKVNEGVMSLETKQIEGMSMSVGNAELYIAQNPSLAIAVKYVYDPAVKDACIGVPKGNNAALIAEVNRILKKLNEGDNCLVNQWYDEAVTLAKSLGEMK